MECRDVRELADSFLSEELLTETNHDILRHLETCPTCRADVAARRAMRDAVRRAFLSAPDLAPDPEMMARVRRSLAGSRTDRMPARRGVRAGGWLALAATILLAAFVGVLFRGRGWLLRDTVAQAAVGDHRNCALAFHLAEKPITLEDAAKKYGAVYRVLQTVPPNEVTTAAGVVRVLERHACVYEGRRFAHVVMDYHGVHVSMLVTDGGDGSPAVSASDVHAALRGERIDSMSVVSWRAARHDVFLVGDVPQPEMVRLAEVVAASVGPALSGG